MKKDIAKIEEIIDKDYKYLKLWKWNREFALLSICTEYEKGIYILSKQFQQAKSFEEKNFILIKNKNMFNILDWLIRQVYKYCSVEGGTTISDLKNIQEFDEVIFQAFSKAEIHKTMEDIFSPYWAGMYNGEVQENETGHLEANFKYVNERTAEFEGINSMLLKEHNQYHQLRLNRLQSVLQRMQKIRSIDDVNRVFSLETQIIIENLFDLPDNFKIGPYLLRDIKIIWHKILFEVWYKNYENRILLENSIDSDIEITDLMVDRWHDIDGIEVETIKQLVDDLTYTGEGKKNQKNATPRNSPILRFNNGKYVVSPNFIINNSSQRSIIATLGHMYGDDTNRESETKEAFFISELNKMVEVYPHIHPADSVPTSNTNVDYVLYDTKSKTMCLFELKWLLEPVSTREIKNKDAEIAKGLAEQLPKYMNEINSNLSEFVKKAYNKELKVEQLYCFVLTKVTIGSGLITPSNFKVINIRMLKKALFDSSGCLNNAALNLVNEKYYPKKNKDFKVVKITKKIGDVLVNSEGIIHLSDNFNLSID